LISAAFSGKMKRRRQKYEKDAYGLSAARVFAAGETHMADSNRTSRFALPTDEEEKKWRSYTTDTAR
jgi:hypothetical protein